MCNPRPLSPLFAFHCSFVSSASCMSQAPLSLPCVVSLHGMIIISYCITISTTQLFVQSPSPDPLPPIESLGWTFREQSSNHIFLGPLNHFSPSPQEFSFSRLFTSLTSALSLLLCIITKLSLAWFTTSHLSSSKCTVHWSLELLLGPRLPV